MYKSERLFHGQCWGADHAAYAPDGFAGYGGYVFDRPGESGFSDDTGEFGNSVVGDCGGWSGEYGVFGVSGGSGEAGNFGDACELGESGDSGGSSKSGDSTDLVS